MIRAGTPKWMLIAGPAFLFVFTVGLGLLFWSFARSRPSSHSPPFGRVIWVLVLFGSCAAFVFPWLYSLVSREVRFFDHVIGCSSRSGSSPGRLWKYDDISGWAIVEKPFRGKTVRLLLLTIRGDRGYVLVGIADAIRREQIAQLFRSKSVEELRDEGPISMLLAGIRSL